MFKMKGQIVQTIVCLPAMEMGCDCEVSAGSVLRAIHNIEMLMSFEGFLNHMVIFQFRLENIQFYVKFMLFKTAAFCHYVFSLYE